MTYEKEDFLDFKFGDHWASEYGLVRVSNSKRYDANVTPTLTDKTIEVPGGDGMYFFSTYHKQRQFTVQVAFDHITESQLRAIRVWLNGKDVQPLIFAEDLYRRGDGTIPPESDPLYNGRQYFAKVTGAPSLKYVSFDEYYLTNKANNTTDSNNITQIISWDGISEPVVSNIPKGVVIPLQSPVTGTLEASADTLNKIYRVFSLNTHEYVDYITLKSETESDIYSWTYNKHVVYKGEGTIQFTCYDPYAYSIKSYHQSDIVNGEVDTSFVLTTGGGLAAGTTISVNDIASITIPNTINGYLEWNSNTGMVIEVTGQNTRIPILFTGKSMALLPVGTTINITVDGTSSVSVTLTYYNRYY